MDSPLEISPCSLCSARQATNLFPATDRLAPAGQPFTIVRCTGCGVLRTMPEMSDAELGKFYPQDYWGGVPTPQWLARTQRDKIRALKACKLTGGRILDVGCGAGFFLSQLDEKRWERFGVEISPRAAQVAGVTIGENNVFAGTLLGSSFGEATFDLVTFWSSLEHMNDPRANLLKARSLLKNGGTVFVELPNAASYQARAFRGHWFSLDVPRHRYHFTPESLTRVLQETGFDIYYRTFHSRLHNAHALRQSLKTRLWKNSFIGSAVFLSAIPMIKPLDYLMSSMGRGATMTFAARAV